MAIGPIDYTSMLAQPDFSGLGAIAQQIQLRRAAEEKKKLAEQAVLQKAQDIRTLSQNPTRQGLLAYQLKYPDDHDAFKNAWGTYSEERQRQNLSDMSQVYSALQNKRPDFAKKLLTSRREALVNSGEDTTETDRALALLDSGEQGDQDLLKGIALNGIGVATGPDKFEPTITGLSTEQRESALFPDKLRKGRADAKTSEAQAEEAPRQQQAITRKLGAEARTAETTADYAPRQQEAELRGRDAQIRDINSQIKDRADRLALDRDKLETDTQLALDKMDYDRSKLSDSANQQVATLVADAESSRSLARRSANLAERFKDAIGKNTSGFLSWIGDATGISGQDAIQLRRDYTALINQQAIKNLPPGPASDKDVALALRGFPPKDARPSTVESFLRGLQKIQEYSANSSQGRADWIGGNGGTLSPLRQDTVINGTRVPKGTSWADFSKSRALYEQKQNDKDAIKDRSYMKYAR